MTETCGPDRNCALPPLVLASMSPRRRLLLGLFNIPFSVVPSSVDETQVSGSSPEEFALNAAREKALDISRGRTDGAFVLGADTIVVLDVESHVDHAACEQWPGFRAFPHHSEFILGKPSGAEEAGEMLRRLSGRTHRVITGVALCRGADVITVAAETTAVRFRELAAEEITAYIATGEPLDKAGSYGIQGRAEKFIDSVDGDLANVIGLPLPLVFQILRPFYPSIVMPSSDNLTDAYREG